MTSIHTLIPDIQYLITTKGWLTDSLSKEFSLEVARRLSESFNSSLRKPTLRLSQMGPKCPKALWHSIHTPELAEKMPAWVENKFAFGHIIEAWAITLAKAAGHNVTGEQDELIVDGVTGHRDCVIDGCIVDVKSASSKSFKKFQTKSFEAYDDFGYLDQLDGYLRGSLEDSLVTVKDRGYLFAIDKQLGHMCTYEHAYRENSILRRIDDYKRIVGQSDPPACGCGTEEDGESGNIKLDVRASYSAYKYVCFPGLRTFLYANGPRYLTKVVRRPTNKDGPIAEVDKHGHPVYN